MFITHAVEQYSSPEFLVQKQGTLTKLSVKESRDLEVVCDFPDAFPGHFLQFCPLLEA